MKPTYTQLELPLMETIQDLGGRANTTTIYHALAEKLNIPSEEREEAIADGSTHRKWDRAVRWVRQNLKNAGLLAGDKKGVWELTEKAKSFLRNARPGILVTVYEVVDENGQTQGIALWGEASAARGVIEDGMISLILTSPPYPLVTPKAYGNSPEGEYLEWFLDQAKGMYDSLTDDGSMILNLGPVFKKGVPVQSLYIHKLVIALCEKIGFHLAQEFYAHNEGKLPTSHWVTVKRVRVTQSIENVFWLSKTPHPKANNRNVLVPYSESYKKVLKQGGYGVYARPSGHKIDHFNRDNGGRIAGTLIRANSVAVDDYIQYCKDHNLPVHPARMQRAIPNFFIRFLTDPGDIVWEPYCGSNIVGDECIKLGRRFIANDKSLTYLAGSMGRFCPERLRLNKLLKVI